MKANFNSLYIKTKKLLHEKKNTRSILQRQN